MHLLSPTLVALILLLAACAPSFMAERLTATPTTPADTAVTTAPTPSPITNVAPTPLPPTPAASIIITPPITSATGQPTVGVAPLEALTATAANTSTAYADALGLAEGYDNTASPVDLLASYYDAVSRKEYERAYAYWQVPPLDYAAFVAGYADTASVQVIVQPPTRIEGASGSLYAAVPIFLIAQHHDGSVLSFAGCVVTRKSNIDNSAEGWKIYQAILAQVANGADIAALLASECAT